MTTEQYEESVKLQKELENLKEHLKQTFHNDELNLDPFRTQKAQFYVKSDYSSTLKPLTNKFVPIQINAFMRLYKLNVEEEILRLEQKLNAL